MKQCPNPECAFEYGRRKRPHICPNCKAMLGPKPVTEEPKVSKKDNPKQVKHPTVEIEPGLFSVQYHQHNRWTIDIKIYTFHTLVKRCLVKIFSEEDSEHINHCDHHN